MKTGGEGSKGKNQIKKFEQTKGNPIKAMSSWLLNYRLGVGELTQSQDHAEAEVTGARSWSFQGRCPGVRRGIRSGTGEM